jgi:hypothetical protein
VSHCGQKESGETEKQPLRKWKRFQLFNLLFGQTCGFARKFQADLDLWA